MNAWALVSPKYTFFGVLVWLFACTPFGRKRWQVIDVSHRGGLLTVKARRKFVLGRRIHNNRAHYYRWRLRVPPIVLIFVASLLLVAPATTAVIVSRGRSLPRGFNGHALEMRYACYSNVLDACDHVFPYDLAIWDYLDEHNMSDCKRDYRVRMLVEEISERALRDVEFGEFSFANFRTDIQNEYRLDFASCALYWNQYKSSVIFDDEQVFRRDAYDYCDFDELTDLYLYRHQLVAVGGCAMCSRWTALLALLRSAVYKCSRLSTLVGLKDFVSVPKCRSFGKLGKAVGDAFLSTAVVRSMGRTAALVGRFVLEHAISLLLLTFLGLLVRVLHLRSARARYRRACQLWLKVRRNKHLVDHLRPIVLGRKRDQKLLLTCFRHAEDWYRTMAVQPGIPAPPAIAALGGYITRAEFRRCVAASVTQALHVGSDERLMRFVLDYRGRNDAAYPNITAPA